MSSGSEPSERGSFRTWLVPSFDEVTLFLVALACLLVIASPSSLSVVSAYLSSTNTEDSRTIALGLLLILACVGGMALSAFHAFSSRPKNVYERTFLASFALIPNAAAGLFAGLEALNEHTTGTPMLPLLNIAATVLFMYRIAIYQDQAIVDGDARPVDLVLGSVILVAVFAYIRLFRDMSWAMTFSACVAYSTWAYRSLRGIANSAARLFVTRGPA